MPVSAGVPVGTVQYENVPVWKFVAPTLTVFPPISAVVLRVPTFRLLYYANRKTLFEYSEEEIFLFPTDSSSRLNSAKNH
jgi:hypothetical protein